MLTYACPGWEFAADSYLLKLKRLQNRVLQAIGNLPSHTPIRDFHRSFKITYLHDYVTQLCKEQESIICCHDNVIIRTIVQENTNDSNMVEVRHRIDRLSRQWL
jgi:hypothetical protein